VANDDLERFESPQKEEKESVLVATIECLWGGVCGNVANEETFFQAHGNPSFSQIYIIILTKVFLYRSFCID
jgi:hypothetical protein